MISGIQDVYYSVTDPKRALKFYTQALGMRLVNENEFWIALDCHGVTVGLHPEKNPIPFIPRDSHGAHAGATGAVLGAALGGGQAGIQGAMAGQQKADQQAATQLNALALQQTDVRRNFTVSGYVFFPKGDYKQLQFVLVDGESGDTEVVSRPW